MQKIKIIALLFLLFLSGCYYVEQGRGHLSLIYGQIPLKEAIAQEKDPKIKALLEEVEGIKAFGESELGLKPSKNYQGYSHTDQKGVTFVVFAARADLLESKIWDYPIVGRLPYKGFFDLEDAKAFQAELEAEGLDVWINPASAYSSLGWFQDPITTPMLKGGLFGLADDLLHEMTHTTLFIEGRGDFNERLASFVGREGAKQYLLQIKQTKPEELEKILQAKARGRQISKLAHQSYQRLKSLYEATPKREDRLALKAEELARLKEEILRLLPKTPPKKLRLNHAYLMLNRMYEKEDPLFSELWQKSGKDWPSFWQLAREEARKTP